MALAAVLDACVLYPLPLRDTLLRVAEAGAYDPCWSEQILEEVTRNLLAKRDTTEGQARRLLDAMHRAFDVAAVSEKAIARLTPAMTNHPKDRHVLAAAVASKAGAIVTFNLRHFPPGACAPFAIEPIHPDAFLLDLYDRDRDMIHSAINRQLSSLIRPPMTADELVSRLAPTVPNFAQALANSAKL